MTIATEPLASDAKPTQQRSIDQLTGPKGWPLVGHLLQLDLPRLHRQLEEWAGTFGPLFRLRLLRHDVVVLYDPEAIGSGADENLVSHPEPRGCAHRNPNPGAFKPG